MKVASRNNNPRLKKEPDEDWRDVAAGYEYAGDSTNAIRAYQEDLRISPLHENSWHRLMVLYRREKNYRQEWDTLSKAITAFETLYQPGGKKVVAKKITTLSQALLKSTGLADKKGKQIYQPEPLGKWYKRKALLKKKMDSMK